MKRRTLVVLVLFGAFLFLAGSVFGEDAKPQKTLKEKAVVDQPWEKLADTNKDGIVDKVEIEQWKKTHPAKDAQGYHGGPGAIAGQPQAEPKAVVDHKWENAADKNNDGIVDSTEISQWKAANPGKNPPGPAGGPGAGPNYAKPDMDNNPPGAKGGSGTNWENPPGPKGGPGASPNKKH